MRKTTANTGFASGGVTCKLGAFCFYSSTAVKSPPSPSPKTLEIN